MIFKLYHFQNYTWLLYKIFKKEKKYFFFPKIIHPPWFITIPQNNRFYWFLIVQFVYIESCWHTCIKFNKCFTDNCVITNFKMPKFQQMATKMSVPSKLNTVHRHCRYWQVIMIMVYKLRRDNALSALRYVYEVNNVLSSEQFTLLIQ